LKVSDELSNDFDSLVNNGSNMTGRRIGRGNISYAREVSMGRAQSGGEGSGTD
jgi:hypothetical protein